MSARWLRARLLMTFSCLHSFQCSNHLEHEKKSTYAPGLARWHLPHIRLWHLPHGTTTRDKSWVWPVLHRPCALSLRGDFKLPLRTFWRVEPHGLEEPKVSSRRNDGA